MTLSLEQKQKILERRKQLQIQREKTAIKLNDLDRKIHYLWRKAHGIKTRTLKCGCKVEYGGYMEPMGNLPDLLIVVGPCEIHNPQEEQEET